MVMERSQSNENAVTPQQLLVEHQNLNSEITRTRNSIINYEQELERLRQIDKKDLTEQQEHDISDCESKMNAALDDLNNLFGLEKQLKEKIAKVSSVIAG